MAKRKKISRGTQALIKMAIEQLPGEDRNNRYKICAELCEIAVNKYDGYNLEYQLERMNLQTTGKILSAIDEYINLYS